MAQPTVFPFNPDNIRSMLQAQDNSLRQLLSFVEQLTDDSQAALRMAIMEQLKKLETAEMQLWDALLSQPETGERRMTMNRLMAVEQFY